MPRKSVVRLTGRLGMTMVVDRDVNTQKISNDLRKAEKTLVKHILA